MQCHNLQLGGLETNSGLKEVSLEDLDQLPLRPVDMHTPSSNNEIYYYYYYQLRASSSCRKCN